MEKNKTIEQSVVLFQIFEFNTVNSLELSKFKSMVYEYDQIHVQSSIPNFWDGICMPKGKGKNLVGDFQSINQIPKLAPKLLKKIVYTPP